MKILKLIKLTEGLAKKQSNILSTQAKIVREKTIIENLFKDDAIRNNVDTALLIRKTSNKGYTTYSQKTNKGTFLIGFNEYSNPIKSIESYKNRSNLPSSDLIGYSSPFNYSNIKFHIDMLLEKLNLRVKKYEKCKQINKYEF